MAWLLRNVPDWARRGVRLFVCLFIVGIGGHGLYYPKGQWVATASYSTANCAGLVKAGVAQIHMGNHMSDACSLAGLDNQFRDEFRQSCMLAGVTAIVGGHLCVQLVQGSLRGK